MSLQRDSHGRRWVIASIPCLLWLGITQSDLASPLIVSIASPQNLTSLAIGQPFQLNVNFSGLAAGEQLVTLTAGVRYTPSLLAAPVGMQAGPIVPNPLATPTDFQTTTTQTGADAAFITSSTLAAKDITSNGVFYRFQLSATTAGSGTIYFDPLALVAEQFDVANPGLPILREINTGSQLSFTVVAPEPHSALLLGFASLSLGLQRRRRRHAHS